MPPKPPKPPKPKPAKAPVSSSRDLVPVGPREVTAKYKGKRNEDGQKPTTARALVLRNGKHGARGTGEIILLNKMSGREKLDLLAEDLIAQSKQALGTPFRLDKCLKIAESQFNAYLDDIYDLQDPDIFYDKIKAEVNARKPPLANSKNSPDPFRNPTFVASIIGARIHNAYMLASAWRIVGETLQQLEEEGVEDQTIKDQLKKNPNLRARYLVLFDVVNVLAEASQAKFALLATTTPHYAHYFKVNKSADIDEPEFVFDWAGLKEVHKSFLDSIIVELCLPRSNIPKRILYLILQEALEESPRDAKRFPQALWDAVGDLSVTVELQEILESALLGLEGEAWKNEPRQMPEEYEAWVDAQIFSTDASKEVSNYKDGIFPLERTKSRNILENMWKYVNLNYKSLTGKTIDDLWHLDDAVNRTPQWHAYHINKTKEDLGYDSDEPPNLVPFKNKKGGKSKPLAITNGNDSDDSMPSLQTVSDSSEAETDDESDDEFESGSEEDETESEYDTDDEDQLRDMLREAMDTAAATADFYDPRADASEFEAMAEERKGNAFIKLLGSLRGRMFSSSPTLKTTDKKEPRFPFKAGKVQPPPTKPTPTPAKPTTKPAPTTPAQPKSHKATVEDVSEEEEGITTAAKKKKKKPKKKKKKSTATEGALAEGAVPTSPVPAPATAAPTSPSVPSTPAPAATPTTPKKKETPKSPAKPASRPPSIASQAGPFGSTASLPLPQEQHAQSAHKYLQTEGLASAAKNKVKSRPDYANLKPIPEKKRFWKFGGKKDRSKDEEEEEDEEEPTKGSKHSFFTSLTKKTKDYMHQLMNTTEDEKKGLAPMKWDNFLKVMREMGFTYDPSTAGSSVRFDPPDPRDISITFHKPHPDPTLYPVKLKEYGKRLKRYYGWSEEDFYRATGN